MIRHGVINDLITALKNVTRHYRLVDADKCYTLPILSQHYLGKTNQVLVGGGSPDTLTSSLICCPALIVMSRIFVRSIFGGAVQTNIQLKLKKKNRQYYVDLKWINTMCALIYMNNTICL